MIRSVDSFCRFVVRVKKFEIGGFLSEVANLEQSDSLTGKCSPGRLGNALAGIPTGCDCDHRHEHDI